MLVKRWPNVCFNYLFYGLIKGLTGSKEAHIQRVTSLVLIKRLLHLIMEHNREAQEEGRGVKVEHPLFQPSEMKTPLHTSIPIP